MSDPEWTTLLGALVPDFAVSRPNDDSFIARTTLLNNASGSAARALVLPTSAAQVSAVVKFALEHKLTVSVKSGGYNTAGWSIAGDIILDLAELAQIQVTTPGPTGHAVVPSLAKTPTRKPDDEDVDPRERGKKRAGDRRGSSSESPPPARKPRPASRTSSSSGSHLGSRTPSGENSEETEETSGGPSRDSGTETEGKGKGKAKASANDVSEVTRSWVADQANPQAGPSHAAGPSSSRPPPPFDPTASYFSSTAGSFATSTTPSTTPSSRSSSSVPAAAPHALVTFGAGARSKALDAATAPFDYYIPLAAYPSGCAIFMSGGFGYLSRLHGLSMDNVVEAEVVLPDGRIVYLTEEDDMSDEMKDLWWAFRGAGVAMGIVTRLRVKAYRVGLVFSGNLIYPFNPATTPSLIKHWRDCCKNAPREAYLNLILTAGPDDRSHVVVMQVCYLGDRVLGDQLVQAIMSWEGERCLLKDFEMRTFLTQQESASKVLRAQAGNRWCIRADLISTLPDDVIHTSVTAFRHIPEGSAWLFEISGGAIADAAPASSCFPQEARSAPFNVAAIHQWKDESDDDVWREAARRWIDGTMAPHSAGGSFPCFIESSDGEARVQRTFGTQNWARLVELKTRLDPQRVLPHTFWPKEGDERKCERKTN
ncbi:hypothetical protein RQP46_004757 [Phenoliferia psychrophenolica]